MDFSFWFNLGILVEKKFSVTPGYQILLVPFDSPHIYLLPIFSGQLVDWSFDTKKVDQPVMQVEEVRLLEFMVNDMPISVGYSPRANVIIVREP
jgi:hypothetical protein